MNVDHVNFPLRLPSSPAKRAIKVLIGRILLSLNRARESQLESGEVEHPFSLSDRLRVAALVDRHLKQGTMDRLARIQERFWAGQQATSFHTQAEKRFQTWWIERHSIVATWMLDEIKRLPGAYHELVEIGCGSGLVLADLATRLSFGRFVGLDLSEEQIRINRERFRDPRLHFEAGDAAAWIDQELKPGSIVFTNAGVLEYFSTDRLAALLSCVASRSPAMIAIVEPLGLDYDPDLESEPRTYGAENSLSRPYLRMLRHAGFTIRQFKSDVCDGHRMLICLATS